MIAVGIHSSAARVASFDVSRDVDQGYVMQLGMVGLGRMGANMVRRLMAGGHECAVHDISKEAVDALVAEGAAGSTSLEDFVSRLARPRAICLMVPAAFVGQVLDQIVPLLAPDDIIIDGGNSHYHERS